MTISTTDYFVRNVKAILARQGLNVSELAKLSGISQGGLSDLLSNEKGRSPSLEYAERIATALGYPLVALISDMEYPPIKCDMSDSIGHCCKVSDEAAFCLIQRPYISKTLLTRRISPRGSP